MKDGQMRSSTSPLLYMQPSYQVKCIKGIVQLMQQTDGCFYCPIGEFILTITMISMICSLPMPNCCSTQCLLMLHEHKSLYVDSSSYIFFLAQFKAILWFGARRRDPQGVVMPLNKLCLLNSVTAALCTALLSLSPCLLQD